MHYPRPSGHVLLLSFKLPLLHHYHAVRHNTNNPNFMTFKIDFFSLLFFPTDPGLVVARCSATCHVINATTWSDSSDGRPKEIARLNAGFRMANVAVSPYLAEVACVTESGAVTLWNVDSPLKYSGVFGERFLCCDCCVDGVVNSIFFIRQQLIIDKKIAPLLGGSWWGCQYTDHLGQIVLANNNAIELVDIRVRIGNLSISFLYSPLK